MSGKIFALLILLELVLLEHDGRKDEEIAKSIIDESDVICYVVTDDSIQNTELEWMRLLKEK